MSEIIEILAEDGDFSNAASLSNYDFGMQLGSGATAKVFYAHDHCTGESFAVKTFLKSRFLKKPGLPKIIKREISVMKQLSHPNIVKLHEVMGTKEKIYIVMEFVKEGDLAKWIQKHGHLTEDLSRKYFKKLISAVGYCHSKGVYHRDIKLDNILIDEDGYLKLSDFGVSALKDQIKNPDGLLRIFCGTREYMAPEILAKEGYDGAKVDVWSCGVVLFALAAGYLPFDDHIPDNLENNILRGEYACPSWMSQNLTQLISRILDINPETRITIDDILKDPWLVKGGRKPIILHNMIDHKGLESKAVKSLNAFDLLSFSPALDLSDLFPNSMGRPERFISEKPPEKLAEEIEIFARAEKLRMRRKHGEYRFQLQGQNGKFIIKIYILPLSDRLVVVEARRRGGDADCYKEMWNNKLRLLLINR